MKIDLYTKVVLTVIALCLIHIVAKDVPFIPEAQAQGLGGRQTVDVNIVSVAGYGFKFSDVTMNKPYLPVRVFD